MVPQHFIYPRERPSISEEHTAPLVQILTWLLLVFEILSVGAQFLTKRAISRRLGSADALLFAALVRESHPY